MKSLEPTKSVALDEPHVGLVVAGLLRAAVRTDGMVALDRNDHLATASTALGLESFLSSHLLLAVLLPFEGLGLPAVGNRADSHDFEAADARGMVQWNSLHHFPFRTWSVQEGI